MSDMRNELAKKIAYGMVWAWKVRLCGVSELQHSRFLGYRTLSRISGHIPGINGHPRSRADGKRKTSLVDDNEGTVDLYFDRAALTVATI